MIKLSEIGKRDSTISSSKGNQSKWLSDDIWYKADNNGYEGLSEYVVSQLLKHSTLSSEEFVDYDLVQIQYKENVYNGCSSKNFLNNDQIILTLERFYEQLYGKSLSERLDDIDSCKEKFKLLVEIVENNTDIKNFGDYLSKVLLIDGLFLNEDRHLHNIAIIKQNNHYSLCPIFDHGACLLSDYKNDYALSRNVLDLIRIVNSKTIDGDFDKQIDTAIIVNGIPLTFNYDEKTIDEILKGIEIYDKEIIERVKKILLAQMYKYNDFFSVIKRK